jgi:hypothetical protein
VAKQTGVLDFPRGVVSYLDKDEIRHCGACQRMNPTSFDDPFRVALATTRERLRRDAEDSPALFTPFFDIVASSLRAPSGESVVLRLRLLELLGTDSDLLPQGAVRTYVESRQIEIINCALYLATGSVSTGSVSTGEMAGRVGIRTLQTYRNIFQRCTGRDPSLLCRDVRLTASWNAIGWSQLVHGELSLADARVLAGSLLDLYGEAFADSLPDAEPLDTQSAACAGPRPWPFNKLSHDAACAVRDELAEPLKAELLAIAKKLPKQYATVVRDFAGDLFGKLRISKLR